ncbi:hypothetical protein Tco_0906595 [Tanacetum coccineum]|uniref:Uncharacterized protein n=1 Tax=Tanacetum coccineum TaxID=301880 RepID=A0ABQ5CH32_9ASTR
MVVQAQEEMGEVDEAVTKEPSMQLKELMDFCSKLQQRVLDLENTKTAQAKEITSLKKRVKRLEKKGGSRTHKLKRLYKIGISARVVSSNEASLGNQEDASKQGRKIDDTDADVEITLFDETQGRHDDNLMFDTGVLNDEEVFAGQDMTEKEVSTADPVTTAGEVVITANVEVSTASPTAAIITNVELTLAQTLAEIKIEADQLLAERLQAREQEELTIKERAKLFQQLLEKRRKFFAAKRAKEKRNKPPTKTQQRSIMTTYLKNMAGWKPKDLKNNLCQIETREEESSKRACDELEQENAKKQKVDDDQETAELQSMIEVIPDKEEVAVDAIPLANKPPSIVDWKIIKDGKIGYYQIIRADGNSKRRSSVEESIRKQSVVGSLLLFDIKWSKLYEGKIVGIKSLLEVTAVKAKVLVSHALGYDSLISAEL